MESGEAQESIVLSRGTTFMAPALSMGVKGLITPQGAPTRTWASCPRVRTLHHDVTFTEGAKTDAANHPRGRHDRAPRHQR